MARQRRDRDTPDLFSHARLFPVETPRELPCALDFNARLAAAMARAIRDCGLDRYEIAGRMSAILGVEVSKAMIDAYTSAARETHTISVVRLKAFIRATGQAWLWTVVLEGDGLTLLQGEEALLAQAALARKQAQALAEEARRLERLAPVQIKSLGRRK